MCHSFHFLIDSILALAVHPPSTMVVASFCFFQELCTHWEVENPEYYALQYTEPTCHYVTEKNRGRIKVSGHISKLEDLMYSHFCFLLLMK